MKSICKVLAAVVLTAGMGVGSLQAQDESPVSFEFTTAFVNQYIWRGFVLNDTPSMQPGFSVGYKDFTVSTWSNISHTGPNGQTWTEHDFTVDYTKAFGKHSVSGGYINYAFPDIESGNGRYTNELYVGYAYDTFLSPSITMYGDFDEGDGLYYLFSMGHSIALPKGLSLNPSVGLGLNQGQWIDQTVVSDLSLGMSLDIPLGPVTLSPFYTHVIGHKTLFGNHPLYGVNMSISK
jgi:hypothetical protein